MVGERRWRAAQLAGLKSIPAVIREAEPSECLQVALVENLHRDDLNGIEEATAYRQLMEEFGLTQEEISQKVGKSRSAVANALRLLQLPVEVQASVVAEEITTGHARALLALQGDPYQTTLLQRIIEEGLSVRETEELVRRRLSGGETKATRKEKPRQLQQYAELISASLQAKVKVIQGKRKGKIVIEFKGEIDLMRLLSEIGIETGETQPDHG